MKYSRGWLYLVVSFVLPLLPVMVSSNEAEDTFHRYEAHGIGPRTQAATNNAAMAIRSDDLSNEKSAKYVDHVNGSDKGLGTADQPWQSITHAVSQLQSGDTLFIRQGHYFESNIQVQTSDDKGVIIRNYPGELVIVDGSIPEYQSPTSKLWELVDADLGLYESTLEHNPDEIYLVSLASQRLVSYDESPDRGSAGESDIKADVHHVSTGPRYVGPGVFNRLGTLLIRVQATAPASVYDIDQSATSGFDPNAVNLTVSAQNSVFSVSGQNIEFHGITVRGANKGFELEMGSSNITFERVQTESTALGIYLNDGVNNVVVRHSRFNGGFPAWIAWTDMKGGKSHSMPAAYWGMKSAGLSGSDVSDVSVSDSVLVGMFDGFVMDGTRIALLNNYAQSVDDFLQLGTNSSHVEVAYNFLEGAGPSHNGKGDTPEPGTVFIHDNVIDSSTPVLWGRIDPDEILRSSRRGLRGSIPFSSHNLAALGEGNPWKIYNNTVVYNSNGLTKGPGYQLWGQVNSTGVPHEVFNNVFVDKGRGRFNSKIDLSVSGQRYDGNIYWSDGKPGSRHIYHKLIDGESEVNIRDVDSFLKSDMHAKTGVNDDSKWDTHSSVESPNLNRWHVPAAGSPAASAGVTVPSSFPGPRRGIRGALLAVE